MRYFFAVDAVKKFRIRFTNLSVAVIVAITGLGGGLPLFLSKVVFAIPLPIIDISNSAQLENAIENQADGQTWNIEAGQYALIPNSTITAGGQTGWYFPITANNITINGIGNPTIYGNSYTANGAWATQDLMAIFGNNVTVNGLKLMPKLEPNKTIEVIGNDTTIKNITIAPNTLTNPSEIGSLSDPTEAEWGGSIYYNNATGTQTLDNVTIDNGGISDHSPSATLNISNVELSYTTNVDWINGYRFATHGNTVNGTPTVIYHVSSALDNLDDVLANIQDGDVISLDSNITTTKQITLDKAVTLNGYGHTISPSFAKNSNGDNAAIGINNSNVTIDHLTVDGSQGTGLHGINVYEADGVALNDVTLNNNKHDGLVVNGSNVAVDNISTSGNGWGGIDVDQGSGVTTPATLIVNGTSEQNEPLGIDVKVDDTTKNVKVVDTNSQYSINIFGNTAIYTLKPADTTPPSVPKLDSPMDRGYTRTNDFYFTWDASTDDSGKPVTYEFHSSMNSHATSGILDTGVWDNIANGNSEQKNLTSPNIHSTGAPDGTWYWQVRAIDAAGNKSAWSGIWYVTIDTQPPKTSLNIENLNNGYVNTISHGNELTITGDASDNLGLSRIYIQLIRKSDSRRFGGQTLYLSGTSDSWQGTENAQKLGLTDGTYYAVATVTDSAGNSTTLPFLTFTLDNTAPATPAITHPTSRQWFKSAPITDSWTAVTKDANGNPENVGYYQIAYNYDDGHSFGGSTCPGVTISGYSGFIGCRDVSGTSRNHTPGSSEQGGVTIWVRAIDKAGNVGDWSKSVHYYYDSTNPTTDIQVTGLNSNNAANTTFAVEGNASDNLSLNRVYVQLVRQEDATRYGGTTINLIPNGINPAGVTAPWSHTYDIKALGLPDGTYAANVEVVDMAGNSFDPGWTADFTVDSTIPTAKLTSPTIDQVITGSTLNITGTATDANFDHYTYVVEDNKQFPLSTQVTVTTPVTNGQLGTWDISKLGNGSYYVVLNVFDKAGNSNEVAAHFTINNPQPPTPHVLSATTTTPSNTLGSNTPGHVKGDSTTTPNTPTDTTNGQVKGDSTSGSNNAKSDTIKTSNQFLGLGWWWLLVLAVIVGFFWYVFAKADEDEQKS